MRRNIIDRKMESKIQYHNLQKRREENLGKYDHSDRQYTEMLRDYLLDDGYDNVSYIE